MILNPTSRPRDKQNNSEGQIVSLTFQCHFLKGFYCFSLFFYAIFCPPFVPRKYPSKIYTLIHNMLYNKISFAWESKPKNRVLRELSEICCYSVAKISKTKFYKLIIRYLCRLTELLHREVSDDYQRLAYSIINYQGVHFERLSFWSYKR